MQIILFLFLLTPKEIPVQVLSVVELTGQPAVILVDTTSSKLLPIFIGEGEATSIEMALAGIKPIRPLTHDLIISLLNTFKVKIEKVVITEMKDNIYYATLQVRYGNTRKTIDSRPSDAIALALRAKVNIYVRDSVLKQFGDSLPKKRKGRGDI